MSAKYYILTTYLLVLLGVGCVHTPREHHTNSNAFSQFRQASDADREALADPVISQLQKRIGMSVSELTQLIGRPEIWDGKPDDSPHADLKYTVYHKADTWRYFVVTIRDWKVVWVGNIETVIQM